NLQQWKEVMEFLEKIRDVFEGLYQNDALGRKWFDPPCDVIKFLSRLQTLGQEITKPMLDRLILHITIACGRCILLFHTWVPSDNVGRRIFCKCMDTYSRRNSIDKRILSLSLFPIPLSSKLGHLGVFEQHGILAETEKRLTREVNQIIYTNFKKLTNILFHSYGPKNGYLTRETCQELLQTVNENIRQGDVFFSPPCSFDRFLIAWDLLQRSLIRDILPTLQSHIRQVTFFFLNSFHFYLFIYLCCFFL
ncbi:hypothetical protein RFI_34169, partial [Reticulomyxa filosa]